MTADLMELAPGTHVELPGEPRMLREELVARLLDGQDLSAEITGEVGLGAWLWGEWQPTLEPLGLSRDQFIAVLANYFRELWLWLIGDRLWSQCISGLVGRIARRVPTGGGA